MKIFEWRISPRNINVDDLIQKNSSPSHPLKSEIWGKAKNIGLQSYDLEGIDRFNNIGVFKFKKRMGGDIKELIGLEYYPLNIFLKFIFIIYNFLKK